MAKNPKPSPKGLRNDNRPNGKAWKQGKAPEVREAERLEKARILRHDTEYQLRRQARLERRRARLDAIFAERRAKKEKDEKRQAELVQKRHEIRDREQRAGQRSRAKQMKAAARSKKNAEIIAKVKAGIK